MVRETNKNIWRVNKQAKKSINRKTNEISNKQVNSSKRRARNQKVSEQDNY